MRTMLLALLLSLVTAAVAPSGASGQDGFGFEEVSFTVSVGSLDLDVGEQRSVDLRLTDLSGPVGAWTIDITYDPGVVSIIDCIVLTNSICDTSRSADTLRVTGASAKGVTEETTLATITFRCEARGVSALSPVVHVFGIPGTGEQVAKVRTQDGEISCREPTSASPPPAATPSPTFALPRTGMGQGANSPSSSWLAAGLAAVGLAAIGSFAVAAMAVRLVQR